MRFVVLVLLSIPLVFGSDKKKEESSTVTISVGQLLELTTTGTLNKISNQDLPVAGAFKVSEIMDALTPHIQRALKARSSLYTDETSTAVPDKPGARVLKPEKVEEVRVKLESLMSQTVKVVMPLLSLDDDMPGIKISAHDIKALEPILKK